MTKPAEDFNPQKLMELAKKGDNEAFGILYENYFVPIFRFIRLKVNDIPMAEDLTQVTFLKVFKSLDSFQNQGKNPLAYFFTVARNTVFDFFKKKKDLLISSSEDDFSDFWDQVKDHEQTPDEVLLKMESSEQIRWAITQLPGEQQEVVFLRFIRELSYKEIAQILEKKEPAIRQLQCRGLQQLKKIFVLHNIESK